MKFHLASADGFSITGRDPGVVRINNVEWRENFVLFPETGAIAWAGIPRTPEETGAAWKTIIEYAPNIVVIGTGDKHVFPHPSLLRPLIEARIGYEVMDTAAACRTYNVLVSEGRKICAAIIV
jgi:uncharacterized protein